MIIVFDQIIIPFGGVWSLLFYTCQFIAISTHLPAYLIELKFTAKLKYIKGRFELTHTPYS